MKINSVISKIFLFTILYSLLFISASAQKLVTEVTPNIYQVVWDSPSADHSGQMPLGNGNIAAGVYAIEDDAFYMLLSKNDALTYKGNILNTGRFKLKLSPNPFRKGVPFKQTLDLETGSIKIEARGVKMNIWANANKPIYHVEVTSTKKITVEADCELYERTFKPIQDVRLERNGNILWYYTNGSKSDFLGELKHYNVEHMKDKFKDPFIYNTFGNLIKSQDLKLENGKLQGKGKQFSITIHTRCEQEQDIEKWITDLEEQANQKIDISKEWSLHKQWWSSFWNKSSIYVSDNKMNVKDRFHLDHEGYKDYSNAKDQGALVGQSYNMFRYYMACQSRGRIQTKFNCGIFNQDLKMPNNKFYERIMKRFHGEWIEDSSYFITHPDDRSWNRRFTFQNQRLLYWPLFMSGDAEMRMSFLNQYWRLLPMRKAITKAWFGHEGAYYRENLELTGGERDTGKLPPKTKLGEEYEGWYHDYYFTCSLELITILLEHYKYTQNEKFLNDTVVPFAREILTFFDLHYTRDANGKLLLDPAQVLETFWIATNPSPDISGLIYNLDELLRLKAGNDEDQKKWKRFRSEIPEITLQEIDGRTAIAPAEKWAKKKNGENGMLYPLFPFPLYGVGRGNQDIAEWSVIHRTSPDAFSNRAWTQDQIHWAYAGNGQEAKEGLIRRFKQMSLAARFPLYGKHRPDACPDMNSYGSGSLALQKMLVQETGKTIQLLPAWPSDWDTDFKLHLSGGVIISGTVLNGKLEKWDITPASRKKDVIVHKPMDLVVK